MIPVTIITGFLGSGKTTLLRHLLTDPAMSRTAVIMNEFGEIGIDHELIETSDESLMQLTTGCLCCKISNDLVLTLQELAQRRADGSIMAFERVVIETSGLADPAPILHALMADAAIVDDYALRGMVTVVDAVNGLRTLEQHEQAVRQLALADRVIISKTDLAQARTHETREKIRALNPTALMLTSDRGEVPASELFGDEWKAQPEGPLLERKEAAAAMLGHSHETAIQSFCMVLEEPVAAATLALFLEAITDNCGPDLLRVKGIVNIAERPSAPAVLHGVQHIFDPIQWLDQWPSENRDTRIVFIGRDLPEVWFRRLFELISFEVADEAATLGNRPGSLPPGSRLTQDA